ncbi:MAG: hypothetical protein A2W72_17945 [Burkholderiales bacterium RIFCSPLOWO2_12_67_14]|nr:MAG: hypothetical protein A3I64_07075 [Burkholderiales bacterium RIFCSPLOWO2_02_FULL_67_64]OGB40000.1 MAG: hypothetical protein A3E51_05360 [Burkholderiales bacterium RIFCSPHIGHO2_12_FULL_67_38]OGB47901.1 MAG: hypothetical protein A2W72_17945 [Burkholderiales bacterium RIFCSPLOWO2_12_67_14]OGB87185.1 MAG: hypothetical protein A3G82_19445 [Burkholderiales bacterium RIFCSPLOWO2_12_FULL_67_210]
MAAIEIVKKIYRPTARVGKFYAAVYGGTVLLPIGNVLTATTKITESVEKQDDMTAMGGGTHATLRRVTGVTFEAELADLNMVNYTRAVRATMTPEDAGTVVDAPYTATLGSLIPLPHTGVSSLVAKVGATVGAAVVVDAAGYELLPEGVWLKEDAAGVVNADKLWLSYSFADQVVMEALTAAAPELYLRFAGMNEVDGGKPSVIDMWRVSQGVAKQLDLIKKGFTTLPIEGELIKDPTKEGAGISQYMRIIER